MGKKSGPPPPNYTKAAEATAQANQEQLAQQTWANRPTQQTAWGTTSWDAQKTIDPATGKPVTQWTQTETLNPQLQAALEAQVGTQLGRSELANSMLGRVAQEYGQQMDWSQFGSPTQGAQATMTSATTNPYGFGPMQQRINTGLMRTPQLQTQMSGEALDSSQLQGVDDATTTRQRAEEAIYGSATSRLDPQWDRRQEQLETQLANQGISRDSEAYTRAMQDFSQGRNDAYNQAQMSAITGGGAEAQRDYSMDIGLRQQQAQEQAQQFGQQYQGDQFYNQALGQQFGLGQSALQQQLAAQQAAWGQSLGGAQYGQAQQNQAFNQNLAANQQNFNQQMAQSNYQNQVRQQMIAEELQKRGTSLNELNALLTGQQVGSPQFQNFSQAGYVGGADYSGAAQNQYQASLNQQEMKNAFGSNLLQGAGSMAMMFSDRRVKRSIRRIGTHPRGFGVYRYRYVGERGTRIGVIAQDVRRFVPAAVCDVRGVLMVDYSKL